MKTEDYTPGQTPTDLANNMNAERYKTCAVSNRGKFLSFLSGRKTPLLAFSLALILAAAGCADPKKEAERIAKAQQDQLYTDEYRKDIEYLKSEINGLSSPFLKLHMTAHLVQMAVYGHFDKRLNNDNLAGVIRFAGEISPDDQEPEIYDKFQAVLRQARALENEIDYEKISVILATDNATKAISRSAADYGSTMATYVAFSDRKIKTSSSTSEFIGNLKSIQRIEATAEKWLSRFGAVK